MGALTSRQNIGVEEVDIPSNSVYRYPPKSGNYFASHFIMGGEKFDSTHPEGYLFGENTDLNFLGTRPVAFPYAAPPPQEPVKTLRSLINIRKDTLRLVRCSEDLKLPGDEAAGKNRACYNVEFTFDADTQVAITIYYQAIEEFHNGVPVYLPQDRSLQSETVHFKRGVCQQFCLPSHTVNLSEWADDELLFDMDKEVFPMVVQAVVDEGDEHLGHSHILLATFEKHMDGSYCVKPLKQKQVVDGVSYLLQEIYGIENKYNSQESKVADDEISDNSAECVVCLSDVRDTLILPCRHLCLCNACADTLRYQANCCPICRLPFRALLQIRAMRKKLSPLSPTSFNPVITSQTSDSEEHSVRLTLHTTHTVSCVCPLSPLRPPPPLHSGPSHISGALPPYSSEPHPAPARSLSPLDHSNSSQGLKLKKSGSKSLSQNSSVLPEEEDEKSCSESEACRHKLACGVTPDSENLTLSSSGAIDQSSCTGTPLSSTITSPEGKHTHLHPEAPQSNPCSSWKSLFFNLGVGTPNGVTWNSNGGRFPPGPMSGLTPLPVVEDSSLYFMHSIWMLEHFFLLSSYTLILKTDAPSPCSTTHTIRTRTHHTPLSHLKEHTHTIHTHTHTHTPVS
uniref:E3 ubiquitin-protein ligase n=1 Tax=Sphaeramia orbicularis TaxID=375764 RepID=A0A673BZ93_9TELE